MNELYLEVRVAEELGEPGLGVEGDLLEEVLVEEVEDDAVARLLEELPERRLQRLEPVRVGRVEEQDLAGVLGRFNVPLRVHLRPRLLGLDRGVRGLRESLEGDRLVPGTAAAAVELLAAAAAAAVVAAAVDAADGAEAREDEDGGARDDDVEPAALDVTERKAGASG